MDDRGDEWTDGQSFSKRFIKEATVKKRFVEERGKQTAKEHVQQLCTD